MGTTRTVTVLEISAAAFQEIKTKLRDAGYTHAFHMDDEDVEVIDMWGIALREGTDPS